MCVGGGRIGLPAGQQLCRCRVLEEIINWTNGSKCYLPAAGSVGATNMNLHSSRSHAIFTLTIECSEKGADGQQHVRVGKLHLVDLAVCLFFIRH